MAKKESAQAKKQNNAEKKETNPKERNWIKPVLQVLGPIFGIGGSAMVLAIFVSSKNEGAEMTIQLFLSSLTEWDFVFYPCVIVISLVYINFRLIKYIYDTKETKKNCLRNVFYLFIIIISLLLMFLSALAATDIFQNDLFPEPTVTPTPIYETIQDLPVCIPGGKNFPCRHYLTTGEELKDIADIYYSNKTELSGRIMELYRDEKGTIPMFKGNKMIIIPEDERPQDMDYYEFYFQLLDYPILKCPYINLPPTPCWSISKGETYEALANGYPSVIKDSCIPGANKTEWSKTDEGLLPKTIEVGTMIVLPVCP